MILLRNGLIRLLFLFLLGCGTKPQTKDPDRLIANQAAPATIDVSLSEQQAQLLQAAKSGDYQQFEKQLEKGVNVNTKDAEGWRALHEASVSGHTDIAKRLIQKGAEVDAKDADGLTPLLVASVNGHTDVVKLLLQNGADVNAKDKDGMTSLHGASVNGSTDIALLLIQNGADVNAEDKDGKTPLQRALSVNRTNMVKLLIQNGAIRKLENPGNIVGLVKDALTGEPLSGASVKIFHQGHLIKIEKTETNGHYALVLSEGSYILEISLAGYIPATVHIDVTRHETTTVTSVRQVPQAWSGKGIATGQLLNAFNGQAVSNATLKIRSGINVTTGTVVATTTTDNNGHYRVNLPGGNYTIEAIKNGYITIDFPIVCIGKHTTDNQNASITPTINPGEIRIVLSWSAAQALDLDSHLLTPNVEEIRYHVYFSSRGRKSLAPYVQLDVDNTNSGPETITIYKPHPGTYRYYVHNYNDNPPLRASDARVEIFSATGLLKSYNVPLSCSGKYWHVFSYNGSTSEITTIDQISSVEPN